MHGTGDEKFDLAMGAEPVTEFLSVDGTRKAVAKVRFKTGGSQSKNLLLAMNKYGKFIHFIASPSMQIAKQAPCLIPCMHV